MPGHSPRQPSAIRKRLRQMGNDSALSPLLSITPPQSIPPVTDAEAELNAVAKRFYDHPDNQKPGFFDYEENTVTGTPAPKTTADKFYPTMKTSPVSLNRPLTANDEGRETLLPSVQTAPPLTPLQKNPDKNMKATTANILPVGLPTASPASEPVKARDINLLQQNPVQSPVQSKAPVLETGSYNNKNEYVPNVSFQFLRKNYNLESSAVLNQKVQRTDKNGNVSIQAYGLFQIRRPGLRDTGFMNKDGVWTGKMGIYNDEDFLNNRNAQLVAIEGLMKLKIISMNKMGLYKAVGQTYTGKKGVPIRISNSGLMAAALRQGQGYAKSYIRQKQKLGWDRTIPQMVDRYAKDNPEDMISKKEKDAYIKSGNFKAIKGRITKQELLSKYESVETAFRRYQDIPFIRSDAPRLRKPS